MSYSTVEQVRDALTPGGRATDRTTAAGLTDAQIQDAIDEADSKIDLYLSSRYITPITADPTPRIISFWSRSIAAYLATLTRAKSADIKDDDPVARRYRAIQQQLELVQQGKAQLPIDQLPADAAQSTVTVQNQHEGDLFLPGDYSLIPKALDGFSDTMGRWPYVWPSGSA